MYVVTEHKGRSPLKRPLQIVVSPKRLGAERTVILVTRSVLRWRLVRQFKGLGPPLFRSQSL